MIRLKIKDWIITLTEENESSVKNSLKLFPLDSKVTILETGEVLQINDIFNYDN